MKFESYMRTPRATPWFFWVLYGLFICNEALLKRSSVRHRLWMLIKCELFYIGGNCRHSGQCCDNMMIVHQGKAIRTKQDLEHHMSGPRFSQFVPQYQDSSQHKIACFSCQWLTPEKKCAHYEDRPLFCRQYPMSTFLQHTYIHSGCGYSIQRRHFSPKVTHPILQSLIAEVESVMGQSG